MCLKQLHVSTYLKVTVKLIMSLTTHSEKEEKSLAHVNPKFWAHFVRWYKRFFFPIHGGYYPKQN